eukprot:6200374-Pleurochrysis_carterae.AAC.1
MMSLEFKLHNAGFERSSLMSQDLKFASLCHDCLHASVTRDNAKKTQDHMQPNMSCSTCRSTRHDLSMHCQVILRAQ